MVALLLPLWAQLFNVAFDQLITGTTAGWHDIAMSSQTGTKDRQQAVDMVT